MRARAGIAVLIGAVCVLGPGAGTTAPSRTPESPLGSDTPPPGDVEASLEIRLGVLRDRAVALAAAGERDRAEDVLREMAALDPDHPKLAYAALEVHEGEAEGAARWMHARSPAGEAWRPFQRGLVAIGSRRWEEARQSFRAALDAYRARGHRAGEAACRNALGMVAGSTRRPDESEAAFTEAVRLLEALGDPPAVADVLFNQAGVLARLGSDDRALALYDHALEIRRRFHDDARAARTLRAKARIHRSAGRYAAAVRDYRAAASTSREAGDRKGEIRALHEIGRIHAARDETLAAEEALQAALEIAEAVGDSDREAALGTDLAVVHLATGELSLALTEQQNALTHYRQVGDVHGELLAVNNLGAIYYRLGDLGMSRSYFERSLSLARAETDRSAEARAQGNLGAVLAREGRFEEALAAQRSTLELCGDSDPHLAAQSRVNAAWVLHRQGRDRQGLHELEEALRAFSALGDERGRAQALNLKGHLLDETGDLEAGWAAFTDAVDLAWERGLERELHVALGGRAKILEGRGRRPEALAEYGRALDIVERGRTRVETGALRTHLLLEHAAIYERAIHLSGELDRTGANADGFRFAERARARTLLDLLAESRQTMRRALSPDLAARERELLDRASSAGLRVAEARDPESKREARRDLLEAETGLQRFAVELRRQAVAYGQLAYPEPAGLKEVQSALGSAEVLLQYFVGEQQAWMWIVQRDAARFVPLPEPRQIERAVAAFLERAGKPRTVLGERIEGLAEADLLSELVLPEGSLPSGRRLLVCPDGPLHRVPFGALRRGGRFLAEAHEIAVVPSATMLVWFRAREPGVRRTGFVGFGAPLSPGDDTRFPPIPHAREALSSIAVLFPAQDRTIVTGEDMTEQRLRSLDLTRYRYVHFATHGWLDDAAPRHSGLLLSPPQEGVGDRFLYLDEVFSLNLDAELVVLAACRSGSGEVLRGEGVIGLTRAFLHAGARSVLVSLWNVSDDSTARFMEHLYRELTAGRSPADALHRTRLSFLGSDQRLRRQPYRWAPFVLVGDPGPARNLEPALEGADTGAGGE